MAIFSRDEKNLASEFSSKGITTISQGTTITGNMDIQCNLLVDGKIKGDILSTSIVTIGTHGEVEGKIVASKIIISGIFKGQLDADSVELLASSIVQGDIISERILVEDGSNFEGTRKKKKKIEALPNDDDILGDLDDLKVEDI
ncbi:MAG: polymer-forming cytoskeletal protein [Fusobacteriaceae bacterium]|jgi:cytoskeletal protein CcmA (bactofilin family)|nr:polymer-forming cytoskeletal protein [Fusobacteriaceae bacterium]